MFKWVGKVFKYKEWSDWDRNLSSFKYLSQLFAKFFRIQDFRTTKARDFNTLANRYKLDNEKLRQTGKSLLILSGLCLILSLLLMSYAIYHFIMWNLSPAVISLSISFLTISLAFRYHFYYTLIKYKRLNCNIKDWFILNFKKE